MLKWYNLWSIQVVMNFCMGGGFKLPDLNKMTLYSHIWMRNMQWTVKKQVFYRLLTSKSDVIDLFTALLFNQNSLYNFSSCWVHYYPSFNPPKIQHGEPGKSILSDETELDWEGGAFCMLVYPWTLRPGLQVLATASHYWPLDAVDGIHELWDQIGNRPGYVNGSNISMSHT